MSIGAERAVRSILKSIMWQRIYPLAVLPTSHPPRSIAASLCTSPCKCGKPARRCWLKCWSIAMSARMAVSAWRCCLFHRCCRRHAPYYPAGTLPDAADREFRNDTAGIQDIGAADSAAITVTTWSDLGPLGMHEPCAGHHANRRFMTMKSRKR